MRPRSVQCPSCGRRYPLPDKLFQRKELAVRCPACGQGFRLRLVPGGEEGPPAPAATAAAAPPDGGGERGAPPPAEAGAVAAPPAPAGSDWDDLAPVERQRLERRARRLARALILDLMGRPSIRERRDRALASGRLLLELGPEIRRAWEEYRSQLGDELARRLPAFREALNEMLADGKPLF